jgi:hypothetical protein
VPVLTGYSETGQGWWTEGLAGLRADPGGMPENVVASTGDISHCLNAGGMGRIDYETETLIAHSLRADGFDASEDGTGRGTPIVPIAYGLDEEQNASAELMGTLKARMEGGGFEGIVAFSAKDHGADAGDISPTLRAGGHHGSHANGGVMPAVAFNWTSGQDIAMGLEMSPTLKVGSGFGYRVTAGGSQWDAGSSVDPSRVLQTPGISRRLPRHHLSREASSGRAKI